jgi:hypothetical protein
MKKNDFSNLGKDIKELVKNTINSGDYQKISQEVGTSVNSALETAFEEARKAINAIQMDQQYIKFKTSTSQFINNQQQKQQNQWTQQQPQKPQQQQSTQQPSSQARISQQFVANTSLVKQKASSGMTFPHAPVGKVAGILQTVFGTIGIGFFGLGVLTLGALGLSPTLLGMLLVLLTGSILMEMNGSTIRNRIKRYKRYLALLQGKNDCAIEDLASYSGFTQKFVVRDLKKMIEIGMFPEGHIDQQRTVLMLNRERYRHYLSEQAEAKEHLMIEQQKAKDIKGISRKKSKEVEPLEKEASVTTPEEGRLFIQQINEAKSSIVDEGVSSKVNYMEIVITKIIDYVESHPEQRPEVRRFMEYYLPTTIKLLNAYHEFEKQPIQGENITTAKFEIKEALDTINLAFENLFDHLFHRASMDVSTDISVLHTMLAQEGLTEQDFSIKH